MKKIKVPMTASARSVVLAGQSAIVVMNEPVPVTIDTKPMLDDMNRYLPFGGRVWLRGPRVLCGIGFRWDCESMGLVVLASLKRDEHGETWLHVSYSLKSGLPSHRLTAKVRESFCRPESVVVALWPPVDEYVNDHEGTLHLWERVTGSRLVPDLRSDSALGKTI